MKVIKLTRVTESVHGTFGVLIDEEKNPFSVTVERPWKDNKPDVSCIPVGEYTCRRTISPHFGQTFEVLAVPSRSNILLHKGNYATDSKGCIVLGESFEPIAGITGVMASGVAFSNFLKMMDGQDEFKLIVASIA